VEWKERRNNAWDDISGCGSSWMCTICSTLQLVWLQIHLLLQRKAKEKGTSLLSFV